MARHGSRASRPHAVIGGAIFFIVAVTPCVAADFAYVNSVPVGAVAVNSRPLSACAAASLPGARCLPADDLLGPHDRLPPFPDLLWALGTAELSGTEHVVVVGGAALDRDFVAGLLYLAGQAQVDVLTRPVAGLPGLAPGRPRETARTTVFRAPMRDGLLVLGGELGTAHLLDGRSQEAYWGETVTNGRGGHLPGAENLPATEVVAAVADGSVAYGAGPRDGIATWTRLRAGAGLPVRVYPGGWSEWASAGCRPADAATYATGNPGPDWRLAVCALAGAAIGASAVWVWNRKGRERWTSSSS